MQNDDRINPPCKRSHRRPEIEVSVAVSGHSITTIRDARVIDDGGGEDSWALERLLGWSSKLSGDHLRCNSLGGLGLLLDPESCGRDIWMMGTRQADMTRLCLANRQGDLMSGLGPTWPLAFASHHRSPFLAPTLASPELSSLPSSPFFPLLLLDAHSLA